MNRNEYNGWTNYETWLVKLWLDNEPSTSADMAENARTFTLENGELAQSIKEYVEDMTPIPDLGACLVLDLINAALAEVNWQEIAKHYAEEAQEDAQ